MSPKKRDMPYWMYFYCHTKKIKKGELSFTLVEMMFKINLFLLRFEKFLFNRTGFKNLIGTTCCKFLEILNKQRG